MIDRTALKRIARARLKDAEALCRNRRYDGARYLCGYSIELALKSRICRTLKWKEFPEETNEFQGLTSLKTHNLDILLRLSGVEEKIKTNYMVDWSIVASWDPQIRYNPVGSAQRNDVRNMLASAKTLLRVV